MKKLFVLVLAMAVVLGSISSSIAASDTELIPRAVAKNETEPNNTLSTANSINQDDQIYATIGQNGDNDFYKITARTAGTINFWLGDIPAGKDFELYVYNSAGVELGKSTGTGAQSLSPLP